MSQHEHTLSHQLAKHAETRPDQPAYTFLQNDMGVQQVLTFEQLDRLVDAVATQLRAGLQKGDRALLLLSEGRDFVPIFLGCLRAGVVAVPAHPPTPDQLRQRPMNLLNIARDCSPNAVVTDMADALSEARSAVPELTNAWWTSASELKHTKPARTDVISDWNDIAFLQYTSGSTGAPKGVVVHHGALVHNQQLITMAMKHGDDITIVGWLPLFHDMGLIGNVLNPLWVGGHSVLMAPSAFIKRPIRWLRAISDYRAHTSGGPNFAFDLCTERIKHDDCEELDLSNWSIAYNGSEQLRAKTLESFADRFADYGFRKEAFYTCYGLAEATLFVTGASYASQPTRLTVDRQSLTEGKVVPTPSGRTLVSSGTPYGDRQVIIVDPATRVELNSGVVGEIWIGGPGLPPGYWGKNETNRQVFGAKPDKGGRANTYVRSGDLGFVHAGELFVVGRHSDVLVVNGRNHHPHDLETTAEAAHPAVRRGYVVAFSIDDGATERVVLVFAINGANLRNKDRWSETLSEVVRKIRTSLIAEHGVGVDDLVLTGQHKIPKTSSGKLQRSRCREAYLAGNYGASTTGG